MQACIKTKKCSPKRNGPEMDSICGQTRLLKKTQQSGHDPHTKDDRFRQQDGGLKMTRAEDTRLSETEEWRAGPVSAASKTDR